MENVLCSSLLFIWVIMRSVYIPSNCKTYNNNYVQQGGNICGNVYLSVCSSLCLIRWIFDLDLFVWRWISVCPCSPAVIEKWAISVQGLCVFVCNQHCNVNQSTLRQWMMWRRRSEKSENWQWKLWKPISMESLISSPEEKKFAKATHRGKCNGHPTPRNKNNFWIFY